jgi:hypothetical protein
VNRRLDLDLRVAATLDCEYTTDGPYVAAVVDRSPDRCEPAEGGAVCELVLTVRDVCVEDERCDLLTGASTHARRAFAAALQVLVIEYDDRTRAICERLEEHERTKVVDHGD